MKKTICYLLMTLLLVGGCSNKGADASIRTGTSAPQLAGIGTVSPLGEEKAPPTKTPAAEDNGPTEESTVQPSAPQTEGPAEKTPSIHGYEDFMNVLSAAVIDGKGNKNLSPVSVYLALAMTAEGAAGDTQAELLSLLGAEKPEDLRASVEAMTGALSLAGESGEVALANSLWMGIQDEEVTFRQTYLNTLAHSYDAEANAVRFDDPATGHRIAAWIQEKTRDKLKISDDAMQFDADTLAVLINTIYLKDGWRRPFEKRETKPDTFFGANGEELKVEYMHQNSGHGVVFQGEGYLRYAMRLREVGSMVFVLPDEGVPLDSLLGSPERIEELLHGGVEKKADVDVKMPKFSFQDRTDLEETLMGLGVGTCFTAEADFSAMTDTPAHVSKVLQESCVGVDEDGVVAAAYTMVTLSKSTALHDEWERVDFHLTRPFLYAIEAKDGTVLFIGTVTAPTAAK